MVVLIQLSVSDVHRSEKMYFGFSIQTTDAIVPLVGPTVSGRETARKPLPSGPLSDGRKKAFLGCLGKSFKNKKNRRRQKSAINGVTVLGYRYRTKCTKCVTVPLRGGERGARGLRTGGEGASWANPGVLVTHV